MEIYKLLRLSGYSRETSVVVFIYEVEWAVFSTMVMCRDFNEVLSQSEQLGGNARGER